MSDPVHILGISAFYHDSAACLLRDGQIVAAAQEERFSRKKHDDRFPIGAIQYCLREGGIDAGKLDLVAFYDKPLLKFERLLETYLVFAPRGLRSFAKAIPLWLRKKLHLSREIDRGLSRKYRGRYVFTEHHEAHAASAFFPSPFTEAAILTMDGVGEWTTASFGVGKGNRIELTHEMRFPHSLGLLYSAFTYFTGFRVNSGEYKLMGLAPYGRPVYRDAILKHLIDFKEDGSFWMDQSYFDYCAGLRMTSGRFDGLFGGPPRRPEQPITQREMDVAASIQSVTEEIVLRMARHVAKVTGQRNLVLAGGVALNCVANGRILREGIFDRLWIQPAAGDAGGALGAALFAWHQLLARERSADGIHDSQRGSLLGPKFSNEEIVAFLDSVGAKYQRFTDEGELLDRVADLVAAGGVVGWVQGRMEFGPRALGSRSILGDARSEKMQSVMNVKIKFRESFRPFAPSVLKEESAHWFDVPEGYESPYMLLVADVAEQHRVACDTRCGPGQLPGQDVNSVPGGDCHSKRTRDESGLELQGRMFREYAQHDDIRSAACSRQSDPSPQPEGIDRLLKVVRSTIPAVTHVDYSARIQTVDPERHGRFYRLLQRFFEKTGCPVMVNTSFNVRGEPIVCTPAEAWQCFMATNMDALVLEDCLLLKSDQPAAVQHDVDEYLARRELD
ncbi:MAG: carbamoyltransferase [Tepidisphaeraceae bacterium]